MKILHLTLKKKWFDMIASGEKKEEYREVKLYWKNRLHPIDKISNSRNDDVFKHFDVIVFTNGYIKGAPTMTVECKGIDIGPAKPEWSDNWQGDVFRIKLGEVIK